MSYFITDKCTGCTICEIKCPTDAIWGQKKRMYFIDPQLCIDCNTCAIWCPYDAIQDSFGQLVGHLAAKQIPKAAVDEESCTGCTFCVDICPFDALRMKPDPRKFGEDAEVDVHGLNMSDTVAEVIVKNCVGCRLCEDVCIKECITVGSGDLPYKLSQWPQKQTYAVKQPVRSADRPPYAPDAMAPAVAGE
ncbi:MAG: 4Fe-4S binding protein [Planctomycetes bacterium]|nr:4Fe-4S binding protein [Planctomycetota bacterium]